MQAIINMNTNVKKQTIHAYIDVKYKISYKEYLIAGSIVTTSVNTLYILKQDKYILILKQDLDYLQGSCTVGGIFFL